MIIIALFIALLIAAAFLSYSGPNEEWQHPTQENGLSEQYSNWQE